MAPRRIPYDTHLHLHILPRSPVMNSPTPPFNPINAPIPIPPLLAAPFPPPESPESVHHQHTGSHIHSHSNYTQPRTPPTPTTDSGSSGSDPSSSSTSPSSPATSTSSQTSSLWSSSYASGTGVKLATAMDLGMIFVLIVFIGVIIIQWKRRTGAVSLPVALQVPKNNNNNDNNEKGQLQVEGTTTSSDERKMTITPPRPARSRNGSESISKPGYGHEDLKQQEIQPSLHEAYFSNSSTNDDDIKKGGGNPWAWTAPGEGGPGTEQKRFGGHGGV